MLVGWSSSSQKNSCRRGCWLVSTSEPSRTGFTAEGPHLWFTAET
jgi:hypothetical protein